MTAHFTDRAKKVMTLANHEAVRLNQGFTGPEHILLGLVKEGGGVAVGVLKSRGIDPAEVQRATETMMNATFNAAMSQSPQTPRAERVVESAIEEARNLHHTYVGSEHLLLGLLRVEEGLAAKVLTGLGLGLDIARAEVLDHVGPGKTQPPAGDAEGA